MFKKIIALLVVAAVLFVILVGMQPGEFYVARKLAITAPPEKIFPLVNNQRNWQAWSPWLELDRAAKMSYSGPDAGVGSVAHWSGNEQIGEGSSTITESVPNQRVTFKLDFVRPMKGTSTAEFTFRPDANQTIVTWRMSGKQDFVSKAFSLVMNCQKIVGDQFDKGLAKLRAIAETKA